jgi:hypothetical protein
LYETYARFRKMLMVGNGREWQRMVGNGRERERERERERKEARWGQAHTRGGKKSLRKKREGVG